MKWWQLSIILCCYGFFKEFRPSEPYITPYLTDFKNFTAEQVNHDIYPLGTYFYLVLLVAVFLLTDYLKYKPVILTGGSSGIVTWCLLIFGKTLLEFQIVEFFYGFFMASEVAYYCYIYAKVNKIHYQKVTSHTRAALLLGKACAGGTSQFLVSFKLLNYLQLNYLSICGVGIATFFALFLPAVQKSVYFHTQEFIDEGLSKFEDQEKTVKKRCDNEKCNIKFCFTGFSIILADIKQSASNSYLVKWSVWWAFATCGYLQVYAWYFVFSRRKNYPKARMKISIKFWHILLLYSKNPVMSYCQILWQEIVQEADVTLYHGLVELASSLLGATVAFIVGYIKVPWNLWGEVFLGVLTIGQGSLLFYSSYATKIYIAYALHLIYQMLYHAAITVATYEIAKHVSERSYALVFGICTFLALLVQTTLTIIFIETIQMNIKNQFKIYGGYHFLIGIGFLIAGIFKLTYFKRK